LSGHERETAARLVEKVRALQPDALLTGVGGHGVIATFDSGVPGPALLFRADLDALPIQEVNTFEHRSQVDEVAHKCGHDGHSTILLGFAARLAEQRPAKGKVYLLWQPAEETGDGALAMLADPRFSEIKPDIGFAMHNMTGYPLNSVIVKDGIITAAVRGLTLTFGGATAHASMPEHGHSPALAIAELVREVETWNRNDAADPDFQLIVPIYMQVGTREAFGVAPGAGVLQLTVRSWNDARIDALQARILERANALARRDGLTLTSSTAQHFRENDNDADANALVIGAADACGLPLIVRDAPLKGGEDFGLFSTRFPCSMFMLGSGEDAPPLHNNDYDFPDAMIAPGITMFDAIARAALR
jgi:amidohydrolase